MATSVTPRGLESSSMVDSLPSSNLGFDDLKTRMQAFTIRFDEFIEKGRKRVLEERNQFRVNVAENQEDQRMKRKDIEILNLKSATQAQTQAKEAQEAAEMHAAIATITSQRDDRQQQRTRLTSQIESVKKSIQQRQEAQAQHARQLDGQSRLNAPELDFWQDYLGLTIDGVGEADHIRFTFSLLDEKNWEAEFFFVLSMATREYCILKTKPKLEDSKVQKAVEALNQHRELGPFLHEMRQLFITAAGGQRLLKTT